LLLNKGKATTNQVFQVEH